MSAPVPRGDGGQEPPAQPGGGDGGPGPPARPSRGDGGQGRPAQPSGGDGGQGPPPAQPPTYEAAAARVEEIIRRLDSGEASLNETLELVGEGKRLIEQCAKELAAVGDALEELRLDELVGRLEAESAG